MTSRFSVNLELTNRDLFDLKKIIMDFVQKKAEDHILKDCRNKEASSNQLYGSGVLIEERVGIGEPCQEKLIELLDQIKNAEKPGEDRRDINLIIIPLPLKRSR